MWRFVASAGLVILVVASAGAETVCDVNRDAKINATDALIALMVSIGRDDVVLACPAPCFAG